MDAATLLRVGLRKLGRGRKSRRLLSWFWPSSSQHSDQLRHAWPNVDDYLHINVASVSRIDRCIGEVFSRLDAILYARHLRSVIARLEPGGAVMRLCAVVTRAGPGNLGLAGTDSA
jgi:hypothetical protein